MVFGEAVACGKGDKMWPHKRGDYCISIPDIGARSYRLTKWRLHSQLLLISKNPALLLDVCSFHADIAEVKPFPKSIFHSNCTEELEPGVWWKCVQKTSSDLCDLAARAVN